MVVAPPTAHNADPTPRRAPPVAGNVVRRVAGTVLRVGLALVSVPIYTRMIGMSEWGMLMLFQAAAGPLSLLDLGVTPAMVKRVAEAHGRDDAKASARTVRAALSFSAIIVAIGAALLVGLAPWLARSVFVIPAADLGPAVLGFRIVALSWAATSAFTFAMNVLIANQRYDELLRASTVSVIAPTAIGLAAAAATRTASWTLLGQATGSWVAAAFAASRAAKLVPGIRVAPWDPGELGRLLRFGLWQATANVGVVLANWSDRFVLGGFVVPRVVGFYALAQALQQQVYAVFIEASDVLFPAVSHRQGTGEISAARRLALLAGWLLTTAFGPAAIALGVLGGDFLRLWISVEAAEQATTVLRLLCATAIAGLAAVAPVSYALGMGRSYWQAPFSIVVGIASLGTSLALVPNLGIRGVGIGLLSGALVRWGLLPFLWRSLFEDVTAREFFVNVLAPPLASLALLTGLSRVHDAVPHHPGWLAFLVETIAFVLLVAGLQVAIGEILPGGRHRRREVVGSFRPILDRALSLFGARGQR